MKMINMSTTLQVIGQTDGGLSVHKLPAEYKVKTSLHVCVVNREFSKHQTDPGC